MQPHRAMGRRTKAYLDGKQLGNQAVTGPVGFLYPVSVAMGKQGNGKLGYEFVGSLDEPQIHSVARDADWVKLTYENQKPGGGVPATGPYICAIGGRGPGAWAAGDRVRGHRLPRGEAAHLFLALIIRFLP